MIIDLIQFAERLESLECAELNKPAEPKKVNAVKMDQIPKEQHKCVNFVPSDTRPNALGFAKGTKKYCRLCGPNPYHDTNMCEELLPSKSEKFLQSF